MHPQLVPGEPHPQSPPQEPPQPQPPPLDAAWPVARARAWCPLRGDFAAMPRDRFLRRGDRRLRARHGGPFGDDSGFERLDLALAREDAVKLGVGRVEAHAVTGVDVTFTGDEDRARRKLAAQSESGRRVRDDEHVVQPFAEHRLEARVAAGDVALQRLGAGDV